MFTLYRFSVFSSSDVFEFVVAGGEKSSCVGQEDQLMSIPVLSVLRAGRLPYLEALQLQKHLQGLLLQPAQGARNTLIVVEHEPVYTLGLREKEDPEEAEKLRRAGAQVVQSDRGGLTTFHGPGQLVVYPIIHLNQFRRMPLRTYVSNLEMVAVHTCRLLGVPAQISSEDVSHTGAWVNGNKICAIGVHCKRHVTTHGLALNCDVDLEWFKHIVPCGIKDKGVTSLSQELGSKMTMEEALTPLISSFESIFRCKTENIEDDEKERVLQLVRNEK